MTNAEEMFSERSTVVRVLRVLDEVRKELVQVGTELASHHEAWCARQLQKLVLLYSTLDGAISNLKELAGETDDRDRGEKEIKNEGLEEDQKNIDDGFDDQDTDFVACVLDNKEDTDYKIVEDNDAMKIENNTHEVYNDDCITNCDKEIDLTDQVKVEMDTLDTDQCIDDTGDDVDKSETCKDRFRNGELKKRTQKRNKKCENKIINNDESCDAINQDIAEPMNGESKGNKKASDSLTKCGVLHHCGRGECTYSTKRSGDLKKHIEVVHDNKNSRYKCSYCDFESKTRRYIKTHEKSVHEGRGHRCTLCSFSASYPSRLKDHMDAVHNKAVYQCDECDYTCNTMTRLKHHIYVNHKNKEELLCSKCPYRTTADRYLKNHMKIHMEDEKRQLFCSECDFITKNARTLRVHVEKRHGETPFQPQEYFCELCEYVAHSKNTLIQHRQFKHEGIMHECSVCKLKYSRTSLVYRHMRRKHPDVPIPSNFGIRKRKYANKQVDTQTDEMRN